MFASKASVDPVYAFNSVLKFFQLKCEQINRKETAIDTVRNYVKSIKLFCDMADLQMPWAKIARGLPRAKSYLKYGHIIPMERDGKLVCARVVVYAATPD